MPFKLFDYQQRIVDEARQKIGQGNNGVLIVSPPGSGKSVIIAEIARLTVSKGGRILFFVHRQELVNQIVKSFQKQNVDLTNCTIMTGPILPWRMSSLNFKAMLTRPIQS